MYSTVQWGHCLSITHTSHVQYSTVRTLSVRYTHQPCTAQYSEDIVCLLHTPAMYSTAQWGHCLSITHNTHVQHSTVRTLSVRYTHQPCTAQYSEDTVCLLHTPAMYSTAQWGHCLSVTHTRHVQYSTLSTLSVRYTHQPCTAQYSEDTVCPLHTPAMYSTVQWGHCLSVTHTSHVQHSTVRTLSIRYTHQPCTAQYSEDTVCLLHTPAMYSTAQWGHCLSITHTRHVQYSTVSTLSVHYTHQACTVQHSEYTVCPLHTPAMYSTAQWGHCLSITQTSHLQYSTVRTLSVHYTNQPCTVQHSEDTVCPLHKPAMYSTAQWVHCLSVTHTSHVQYSTVRTLSVRYTHQPCGQTTIVCVGHGEQMNTVHSFKFKQVVHTLTTGL